MDLKQLQEEAHIQFDKKSNYEGSESIDDYDAPLNREKVNNFLSEYMQKSFTLGMMKGVEKKEIVWEDSKDELYTYFGNCPCGATSVIVGSKYCNECGSLIMNPLRSSKNYKLKQELK